MVNVIHLCSLPLAQPISPIIIIVVYSLYCKIIDILAKTTSYSIESDNQGDLQWSIMWSTKLPTWKRCHTAMHGGGSFRKCELLLDHKLHLKLLCAQWLHRQHSTRQLFAPLRCWESHLYCDWWVRQYWTRHSDHEDLWYVLIVSISLLIIPVMKTSPILKHDSL